MTTRRGTLTISGIAADRNKTIAKTVTAIGVAGAMLALAGCSSVPEEGIVMPGADGKNYVVADGTERPTYKSKEDCIADVTEQIAKLKADGETVSDSPEKLCESSEKYGNTYHHAGGSFIWLGPLLFGGSRWDSPRVQSWAPVQAGGFAAPGAAVQPDVAPAAPAGSKVGSKTSLKGGFGGTSKAGKSGGFGSGAKSSSIGHSSFGG
ncbi:hypothetical protein [Leifsonia sp. Leaf264]|uniref:hypothetical protein n=1 Tax=Leifsonia sp. Leaf264 TaxID=1736314 RepID=UPI0006F8B102|nr:hypothetical protein [Leifsonia sp. Leaf264]KQO98921.1 hypothetical protein ASF30_12740 [Leifsonia sp. Leaf264]